MKTYSFRYCRGICGVRRAAKVVNTAVGLPSMIWANRYQKRFTRYASRGVRYTDRFPENEADRLGEKVTGEKA